MEIKRKIFLALGFLLLAFCQTREKDTLQPADEDLLTKPLDNITGADLKKMRVLVQTDFGNFVIAFYPEKAPALVKNFIRLVRQGFYEGLYFHMVVPRYMVIAGDPKGDGSGGPGYWLKPEYNDLPHNRGAVGYSHPPFQPDQIGSQFYVMLTDYGRNTNAYPVFGYVENGMEVLDRIGEIPSSGISAKPPWQPTIQIKIRNMKLMTAGNK